MGLFDILKDVTKAFASEASKELMKNASKQMSEIGKDAVKQASKYSADDLKKISNLNNRLNNISNKRGF